MLHIAAGDYCSMMLHPQVPRTRCAARCVRFTKRPVASLCEGGADRAAEAAGYCGGVDDGVVVAAGGDGDGACVAG